MQEDVLKRAADISEVMLLDGSWSDRLALEELDPKATLLAEAVARAFLTTDVNRDELDARQLLEDLLDSPFSVAKESTAS